MRTLVDTCVLSEAQRTQGSNRVRDHLMSLDDQDFFLSVITIGEVVKGIGKLDAGSRRSELETWIRNIEDHHADRILPIDLRVARIWGDLTAEAQRNGQTIPAADGLIAATALRHDLLVMTRNTPHFEAAGVRLFNPWEE